ncbi:organic solvent tolerance protein OstA [Bacillus sp. FJAT-49736]|uniref:organic solvent tolerance protein OstA n=1 Tax=Bacillus sp. FJAT-49736 TaxID=2833582 RepID=UPI001BCA12AE|nr:organic solvent tolerance protein OstA [Bacillus sp. FJAT-49736]MBS4171925.1 organic solvent tolerance protein OstA [Bacillus sp. FJAT-49736]
MTKVQLNQKEQHYADTREEAEEIISAAKENDNLQMHKITEKYNKYGQYFLIDLTYAYQTPKEVMESRPQNDNVPEGQMSMDDHEGIEYSVDKNGGVSISDGQLELVK